jgi:tetratricopeptide (TPR) repeat protein
MTRQASARALAAVCAVLLVLTAYANFFHNDFHFDDSHVIVENASIHSLQHWTRFFTDAHTFSSLPTNATYRPLVTLSFAIDYAVHQSLDPVPFHVTQLLLLLIVGALLAVVIALLFGREHDLLAITAAAIFCVHTANTETMNFLSSRSELISAIGLLTALIIFIRWPEARRRGWYLVPLALGALAKAPVVVFAGLAFAWVRLIERRPRTEAIKASLPSLIAGGLLLILLNAMNAPEWIAGGGSRLRYLLTQPFVWMHYARLAIVPAGLTADTDLEPIPLWYDTSAIAGYAFVALLCLLIARLARNRESAPAAFGLAWFCITLLPTSSIFPLAEVANEHRLFFPLMGFVPAAVWGGELAARRWPAMRRPVMATLAMAAVALAYGTHVRNRVWATEETLWRDVTRKSPGNGRGWMNYGLTQMEAARFTEARAAFDRAAVLTPSYGTLEINRGIVAAALGETAAAEAHFRRALELKSDRNAHFYYARWLARSGRASEALPHLRASERLAPAWIPPRRLTMQLAVARGDDGAARASAKSILSIDPVDGEAAAVARHGVDLHCGSYGRCFQEGWAATTKEEYVEAATHFRAAVHERPTALALNNLGWSLQSLGFRSEAVSAYRAAIARDPTFERAANNLRALGGP